VTFDIDGPNSSFSSEQSTCDPLAPFERLGTFCFSLDAHGCFENRLAINFVGRNGSWHKFGSWLWEFYWGRRSWFIKEKLVIESLLLQNWLSEMHGKNI
jgi:hypothetical protein